MLGERTWKEHIEKHERARLDEAFATRSTWDVKWFLILFCYTNRSAYCWIFLREDSWSLTEIQNQTRCKHWEILEDSVLDGMYASKPLKAQELMWMRKWELLRVRVVGDSRKIAFFSDKATELLYTWSYMVMYFF